MIFQNSPNITRRFAARDILVNFEISLAVFIPNTPRNHAITYTNLIGLVPIVYSLKICSRDRDDHMETPVMRRGMISRIRVIGIVWIVLTSIWTIARVGLGLGRDRGWDRKKL